MKLKLAEFFALLLSCLVMGVFWGTWFTLTRSLEDFSPAEFIHIGKTIIGNVAMPMRILMPLCLLLLLIAAWMCRKINSFSFYLYSAAFVLMLVSLIITVTVEVPIDNQIKTWTSDNLPADWQILRQRWNVFHTMRTFTSIASVAFFIWGMLKRIK